MYNCSGYVAGARGTVGLSVRRASSLSLPGWDGSVRLVNSV
jgi:hypothetical protein